MFDIQIKRQLYINVFLIFFAAWLPASAEAQISFTLKNTFSDIATFQFFSDGDQRWDDLVVELGKTHEQTVTLNTDPTHTIVFRTNTGYREQLNDFDLKAWSKDNPYGVLTLQQLYVVQSRVRNVVVQKFRTVNKTRVQSYTVSVPEQRTRIVEVVDPRTGKTKKVEQQYTVMVPVTRSRNVTYQVQVPYVETRSETYQVKVPTGVGLFQSAGGAQGGQLQTGKKVLKDPRRRILGVGLANTKNGVLVTTITPASASTNLRMVPVNEENRSKTFSLTPQVSVITKVNGLFTPSVNSLVDALQSSPPIAIITVKGVADETEIDFQAKLTLE